MEGVAWTLFTVDSKAQEESEKLRRKLLSFRDPILDHFGGSSLIQIALIRKFTVERIHFRDNIMSMSKQHFAEESKYVTNENN